MTTRKEKAINLIWLGFTLKFAPLIILVIFEEYVKSFEPILNLLMLLLILGFFIVGYIFLIKGCRLYIKSKGYGSNWGWLGLLSIFGLSVLLLIPFNKNATSLEDENFPHDSLKQINIPELLLTLLISMTTLIYSVQILCISILGISSFFKLTENTENTIISSVEVIAYVIWVFILLRQFPTTEFIFNRIIGYKNKYNWKIISITVFIYAFSKGFYSLTLYGLSLILPHYVEHYINDNNITNIWELIFTGFSGMLLAPVTEEFLIRGIILQKWAIKWGIQAGILTSSFLFAILHLRFDVISLFLSGILYSILYFKTRNLLAPMFCHFFYNTFSMIFTTINYFSKSEIERSAFISLQEYQNSVQPWLGQRVFLIAISAPFLIYFVYKNFPKNDAIIPYYANEAKIH
ncbi:MAG: lysostaphin resistance A-like protein [Cuspidothrix sp.]